ncbi:MAG TPA: 4-(cytidine 5'-diphospho)-2-C-methyl-D-erythritol kinase, partial [Microvirga sp.]|nr:4-(cytidine 5'-diphospho)-2-C-methyl-D-erythritol kinase [Microvirga sp.]
LALAVEGPAAARLGNGPDNLILKAARLLAERVEGLRLGRFRLVKRLPVAAGVGGGSSDAAAALRLIARLNALPLSDPALREAARLSGADVPVCLEPRARVMRGIGDELGPPLALPRLSAVLVNPGTPVATAAVFRELGLRPGERRAGPAGPPLARAGDAAGVIAALAAGRNDLEAPAMRIEPAIAAALDALRSTSGCRLARMSGSGATVFGLYDDRAAAADAAKAIRRARPAWWVKATSLG